mgnify:CR=1 FL=1
MAHKVLQNPLNQIFSFDYSITGKWDDPKVEKLSAQRLGTQTGNDGEATRGEGGSEGFGIGGDRVDVGGEFRRQRLTERYRLRGDLAEGILHLRHLIIGGLVGLGLGVGCFRAGLGFGGGDFVALRDL